MEEWGGGVWSKEEKEERGRRRGEEVGGWVEGVGGRRRAGWWVERERCRLVLMRGRVGRRREESMAFC